MHTCDKFICMFCGALCGTGERGSCLYHPGTLQRSKAGGVWWSCCGAVGFQNSILHSSGGDINAPSSEWRWGCKKSPMHRPLQLFDYNTDPRKYINCTQVSGAFSPLIHHPCALACFPRGVGEASPSE